MNKGRVMWPSYEPNYAYNSYDLGEIIENNNNSDYA